MVCRGALKGSYTNHSVSVAIRLRMGRWGGSHLSGPPDSDYNLSPDPLQPPDQQRPLLATTSNPQINQ